MEKIDKGFDEILKVNYELYSIWLFELKRLAESWYDIDFKEFDMRGSLEEFDRRNRYKDIDRNLKLIKRTGIVCNYFFAYKEEDKYYLLDGFNRLFTEYGKINKNTKVYLKVITDKLQDHKLMSVMIYLNLWKLYSPEVGRGFNTDTFFDRGLRLFLYAKFKIKLYDYEDYNTRKRNENDFDTFEYYFIDESHSVGNYKYSYEKVMKLFMNENIINDLKEISKSNDYLELKFHHYDTFLKGFIMFLSRRRLKDDDNEYKFNTFLDVLYKDKKFFKKLQNMSWTDCSRQNVFKFFEKIENRIDGEILC